MLGHVSFGLVDRDILEICHRSFFLTLASGWLEILTLEEPVRVDYSMLPRCLFPSLLPGKEARMAEIPFCSALGSPVVTIELGSC